MILVKRNEVVEEIEDEQGNKLGVLRFNPNDSRIMNKLSKIMCKIENILEKQNGVNDFKNINKELKTAEDFERFSKEFKKIDEYLDIEIETIQGIISELSEVFGKETIEIFTNGTLDISTLNPLFDFIIPIIKDARLEKVNNYIDNNSEVME